MGSQPQIKSIGPGGIGGEGKRRGKPKYFCFIRRLGGNKGWSPKRTSIFRGDRTGDKSDGKKKTKKENEKRKEKKRKEIKNTVDGSLQSTVPATIVSRRVIPRRGGKNTAETGVSPPGSRAELGLALLRFGGEKRAGVEA